MRIDGIERRHRLLKNHGDFAAAQRAHFGARGSEQIVAGLSMAAGLPSTTVSIVARLRSQASPVRRAPGGSSPISASASIVLPGAGFADDAERLALAERERDVVHRAHPAGARRQLDRQAAHIETGRHGNIICPAEGARQRQLVGSGLTSCCISSE